MRVLEGLRLRVMDVDFDQRQVTVRQGKGAKDRVTMLPASLLEPLRVHLEQVKRLHEKDLANGFGWFGCRMPWKRICPHPRPLSRPRERGGLMSGAGSMCFRPLRFPQIR